MTIYTLNGSVPGPIPFRIRLSTGGTRTDPTSFTAAEIADAGYVEAPEPPEYDPTTQRPPEWDGEHWTIADIPLSECKATKLDAIRALRWDKQNGGTTVNGITIRTDADSQRMIAGAIDLFDKNPSLTAIDFEAQPNEWATLDAAAMTAIGVAVGMHIQACFSNAKALSQAVEAAGSYAALAAIDIEAGWN